MKKTYRSSIEQAEVEQYIELMEQQKHINEKVDAFKQKIRTELESVDANSCNLFDKVKVTLSRNSQISSYDMARLQKERPEIFRLIEEDFTKVTLRKGSLRVTIIEK